MLKNVLFRVAKTPFMGKVVGKAFQYCPWAIPVKKAYISKEVLAFHHPSPSHENHLILSPRKTIGNLLELGQEDCNQYFLRIMDAARDICAKHAAYQDGFVLVANGGKKQEVQQVHFHMFTNHQMVSAFPGGKVCYSDGELSVLEPAEPEWDVHYVLCPSEHNAKGQDAYLRCVLQCIRMLNAELGFVDMGYSLLFQYNGQEQWERPVFHLVAGKKR